MSKNWIGALMFSTCAALAAGSAAAGQAQGPDGLTSEQLSSFVASARSAAKDPDPTALALLSEFPLKFNCAGKSRSVTRSEFMAKGEAAMPKAARRAIIEQDVAGMLRNAQGAMFGDGEVWIQGICSDAACSATKPKIAVVNLCWK